MICAICFWSDLMVYSLKYTKIFKKQIENVTKKNNELMKELMKELMQKVKKLYGTPYSGKPLKYRLIIDLFE